MDFIKSLFGRTPETPRFERLPQHVIPKRYEISFKTDFENQTFSGTESIAITVCRPVSEIVMNSVDLEVTDVKINSTQTGTVSYEREEQKIILTFKDKIPPGQAYLNLSFSGKLEVATMKGYYISKYKDHKGREKSMASTHFEPTAARRAFPCWDEPAFKATFIISMLIPENMVAYSNMPGRSQYCDEEEGYIRINFQETLVMSTYLVGFAVGELESIEKSDSNGVLIEVIAPKGKAKYGEFALDIACKTVPFLGEFFDHKFELPKIDLIAIPEFPSGAMENWGLITFRETTLLINPNESTIHARLLVGLIVCHELAHMWFGNIVTMEWWTDLWLKEGFATWIEYYCFDHCYPEYDIWNQSISNDLVSCMEVDALVNSHPIEVEVKSPAQINTIFDAISYMKGCAIIRMLRDYIGDIAFRDGLRLYIRNHQYANANTSDLWNALEEASGKSVSEIMSTWTSKSGFPLIRLVPERDSNGSITAIQTSQTRYLTSGIQSDSIPGNATKPKRRKTVSPLWHVPLRIVTLNQEGHSVISTILKTENSNVKIETKNLRAFRANPLSCGYYRVWYDDEQLFNEILDKVISKELDVKDRLKFMEDYFSFGLSGIVSLSDVLDVFSRLGNEDRNSCWNIVRDMIYAVRNMLEDSQHPLDHLRMYVYDLFLPVYMRLGWSGRKDDSQSVRQLRSSVITVLGRYSHPDVVAECRKRFANHLIKKPVLESNFHTPVFSTVAVNGSLSEINQLKKLYSKCTMQEERVRILRSLGFSPPEYHTEHIHNFILSDEVRLQDKLFGIISCCWCSKGREFAWLLIKDNWSRLTDSYQGKFLLHHMIEGVTKFSSLRSYADDLENLLNENIMVDRSLNQLIEHVRNNSDRLERDSENVYRYLTSYSLRNGKIVDRPQTSKKS